MKNLKRIFVLATLMIMVVGCGEVPTLKNGEQKVASLEKGGVSADALYTALKDKYGASVFVDLIDTEILDQMYEETKDEKEYLKIAEYIYNNPGKWNEDCFFKPNNG